MLTLDISQYDARHKFTITGVSYIGAPRNNTLMFVGTKLSSYIKKLYDVSQCMIIVDARITVPVDLMSRHYFYISQNPALDYATIIKPFWEQYISEQRRRIYTATPGGFVMGENVKIGANVYIEPHSFLDHDVEIGDNTSILSGAIIRSNVTIGKHCTIKEHAVVGSYGFTFAKDDELGNVRIPSLGGVVIGDNVEIGASATVCSGTAQPTFIGENVKIDDQVHIGHDVCIGPSGTIAGGSILAGYVNIGDRVYIGAGAAIKNRVVVLNGATVGMSARVCRDVKQGKTVMNEPAVSWEEFVEKALAMNRIRKS